jgi:cobalt/nickel transport protein
MNKKWWLIALVFCLILATISPLASSSPDGLEKVAEDKDFISTAEEAPFEVLPDYIFPSIENKALATILAGWLGTLVLFAVVYGLAWVVKIRKGKTTTEYLN